MRETIQCRGHGKVTMGQVRGLEPGEARRHTQQRVRCGDKPGMMETIYRLPPSRMLVV